MESAARTVGVLGTDTMSTGIVQVACRAGYRVVARDRSIEALERTHLYVQDGLGRFAPKSVILESDAQSAYDRVQRWRDSAPRG